MAFLNSHGRGRWFKPSIAHHEIKELQRFAVALFLLTVLNLF